MVSARTTNPSLRVVPGQQPVRAGTCCCTATDEIGGPKVGVKICQLGLQAVIAVDAKGLLLERHVIL